jgi:hypothetical protein
MKGTIVTLATLALAQLGPLAEPATAANGPTFTDADWMSVGPVPGLNSSVGALALDSSGNLYAGGSFTKAGSVNVGGIAKWDGSAWLVLGSWVSGGPVDSLACDTSGNVYAGGGFKAAGTVPANYIAKWNGSAWSDLGSGMSGGKGSNTYVRALVFDISGNLYAGGSFTTAGGANANYIAKWNGKAWSALGSGMGGESSGPYVTSLARDTAGNLYAGGFFTTAGGVSARYLAKWNGKAWSALGSGVNGAVEALACDNSGNLYAGGLFTTAGGVSARYVAKWDGSAWSALGSGMSGGDANGPSVDALAFDNSGRLYAGGDFGAAGGTTAYAIARWDGSAWSGLGSGVTGADSSGDGPDVNFLVRDSFGNLWAGGQFTAAGASVAANLAKALLTEPAPNQLLLANAGSGTSIITYLGTSGASYALDLAAGLTPPVNWIPQATNAASTANATAAGYLMFTDPETLPQAYYRMRSVH